MQDVIQYLVGYWQTIVVSLLAIDAALIPIFPNAGILGKLKAILSDVAPKQS